MTPRGTTPEPITHRIRLTEGDELLRLLRGKAYAAARASDLRDREAAIAQRVREAVETIGSDGELEAGPVIAAVGKARTQRRWKLRDGVEVPERFITRSSATYVTSPASRAKTRGNDAVLNAELAQLRAAHIVQVGADERTTHPDALAGLLAHVRIAKGEAEADSEQWRDVLHVALDQLEPGTLDAVDAGQRVKFESNAGIVGWVADIRVQSRPRVEEFLTEALGDDQSQWVALAVASDTEVRGALRVTEALA